MAARTFDNESLETATGMILSVEEKNPGFFVGTFQDDGKAIHKFICSDLFISPGYVVTFSGHWTHTPQFGRQFRAKSVNYEKLELSPDGLRILLAKMSEAAGIGPKRAALLVDRYGVDFEAALTERPDEVAEVAHVPVEFIYELQSFWKDHRAQLVCFAGLLSLGLTMRQSQAVFGDWGLDSVTRAREDPYGLASIEGIGFKIADAVAGKLGVAKDDPKRIKAGILYEFTDTVAGNGWTCTDRLNLTRSAAERLALQRHLELVESGLAELIEAKKVVQYENVFTTPFMLTCEREFAEFLSELDVPNPHVPADKVEGLIKYFYSDLTPDEDQIDAVRLGLTRRGCLITGGAGVGKTTILRVLLQAYRALGLHVSLAAPTGKAAKRMEQATGYPAMTIHRLLQYHPQKGWQKNPANPIDSDLIIVDEWSMGGADLAWYLIRAIRKPTCIIFVGDHNQLPPVSPGAILRDCTEKTLLPTKILGHCHRQAGTLRKNCAAILEGRLAPTEPFKLPARPTWVVEDGYDDPFKAAERIVDIYCRFIPDRLGRDPQTDCQIIVPQNKDNPLSTWRMNVALQRAWHERRGAVVPNWGEDKPGFIAGDRIIQTKNNYDLEIMNGHQGIVVTAPQRGRSGPGMTVLWEGRTEAMKIPPGAVGDIGLSYALTCHKTQGSEWPIVIVAVHSTNWFMLNRQLLYTAATRGREYIYLIGNGKGLADAIKKIDASRRRTLLPLLAKSQQGMFDRLAVDQYAKGQK